MSLFQLKDFIMHSGGVGKYKIECDCLTDGDWETAAYWVHEKIDFKLVRGVPTGGKRFQDALFKYRNPESSNFLIVDDVLTTGKSMEEYKHVLGIQHRMFDADLNVIGVVLFARTECPDWILPIFKMW
jgi:hypothetical protein